MSDLNTSNGNLSPSQSGLKSKRSQRFTVQSSAPGQNIPSPPLPNNGAVAAASYPQQVQSQSIPPAPQTGGLNNTFSLLSKGSGSPPYGGVGGVPIGGGGGGGGGGKRDSYAGSQDSNPYSSGSPTSSNDNPLMGHFFPHSQQQQQQQTPTHHHNHNHTPGLVGGGGGSGLYSSPQQGQYFLNTPPLPTQSQAYHLSSGILGGGAGGMSPMGSLKAMRANTSPMPSIGRSGLPQDWMGSPGAGGGYGAVGGGLGALSSEDEVIPTAVVVKNIPFNVKREQLLQIFEDLQIPSPYAFNYHFDDGIFRGLAFANFRTPAETDAAVAALNGFDVQGRKLRVEYKKVLKEGEKERIEREKAIKRMRSAVMESQRREREASTGLSGVEDVFGGMSIGGAGAGPGSGFRDPVTPGGGSGFREGLQRQNTMGNTGIQVNVASSSPSDGSDRGSKYELDMNDPQTLEIYSRVLLFKDDSFRDELAFARSLGATQRRIVHLIAQKLDLDHKSVGGGEDRHVVVYKRNKRQDTLSPESAYPPATGARLQAKKSMPDMRTYSPSSSSPSASGIGGRKSNTNLREGYATVGRKVSNSALRGNLQNVFGGYYNNNANGGGGMSLGVLGERAERRVASTPGGDAYGGGYFGADGDEASGLKDGAPSTPMSSVPLRQPKGPDSGNGGNFAQRSVGRKSGQGLLGGGGGGEGEEMQTTKPLEF
ncbi:hypothetical protein BT69DRAFT_1347723 [Atractiella rhizophila]|nr:hypothetical protein BT69DRAFT_1347723 [Atractiella rhizophila]